MSSKEDSVEATADIANPRDVQGILAIGVTIGFLGIAGFALTKAGTMQDVLSVLNVIAAPASLILGFYFGRKAAEGT
jgi:hypothetical protein